VNEVVCDRRRRRNIPPRITAISASPAALCAFHFTDQAIRRSDCARALIARLAAKARYRRTRRFREIFGEVAAQISVTERRAMKAERETPTG